MRTSQYLLATVKETPADATLASHKLMLRAGLIRQEASGIYAWLPTGWRVLKKVEQVVREEMNKAGALELNMPCMTAAELWQETGRWEKYGPELLRITDRHDREFCFGPTHEEVITDIARKEIRSYKQLPLNLYQIQTKFRDEVRPRFGVMRGREFMMKDSYSFHLTQESLQQTYDLMHQTYLNICQKLGLNVRAVIADSGSIGGESSHEFQVIADAGEDVILYSDTGPYAANIEKTGDLNPGDKSPDGIGVLKEARGIEIGHIFQLGDLYSQKMNAAVLDEQGKSQAFIMGCYGFGVSRAVAAAIEQHHDENGIIWPEAMAPFQVSIVPIGYHKSAEVKTFADQLHDQLQTQGVDVLLDDRDERPGAMFADSDLIGIPHRFVISEKHLANQQVEYKQRAMKDAALMNANIDAILKRF